MSGDNQENQAIARQQAELAKQQAAAKQQADIQAQVQDQIKSQVGNIQYNSQTAGLNKVAAPQTYDAQGRPIRNDYLSYNNADGTVKDQFSQVKQDTGPVSLNTDALNKIQSNALSIGPTEYAQAAQANLNTQQTNAQNQAVKANAASTNQATENMAMKGGVSSGSRERIAQNGMNNATSSWQNLQNQGIQGSNQIAMGDAQLKNQMLTQAQTGQGALANFNQGQRAYMSQLQGYDIGNALKDTQGLNAYNSNAYNAALNQYGAEKSSQAQASAGGGGGGGGCCTIIAITGAALGGHNSAKACEIVNGTKINPEYIIEKYKYDEKAMEAISDLQDCRYVRDNIWTVKQKRGYYIFSETVSPIVEKSKVISYVGKYALVKPSASLKNSNNGFISKSIGKFWLKVWGIIGTDNPFKRSNGEIV
jgi:hypothetical protein